MPRIAYVNGRYLPHAEAGVHIEDRGYQFADGVYEVCEIARGNIMDMTRHLDRLNRSLSELQIDWPMSRATLQVVMREVVRRNGVVNGLVYMQVTRGVARRARPAPTRRGSSIRTARSRKAPRPTPGSSPRTAAWSRVRPKRVSSGASPVRRSSIWPRSRD